MKNCLLLIGCLVLLVFGCNRLTYIDLRNEGDVECKLKGFESDTVRLKGVYSGFEEYWSFGVPHCPSLKIELEAGYIDSIPKKVLKKFTEVHNSYWDSHLEMDVVGIFRSNNSQGYGHLGSNNAELVVIDYVKIKLVKSQ